MLKFFRLSSLTLTLGAALLALTAVPSLKAQGGGLTNWRTTVTFSGPVDIGGAALSAGTYVFRTLGDNHNLVQIMNSDETHQIALVQAVSAQAAEPSDNTRIELKEGVSGSPEAVNKWFYPGETIGWEFLPPDHKNVRPSD